MSNHAALKATLQWYLDQGVDEILGEEPVDRTLMPVLPTATAPKPATNSPMSSPQEGSQSQRLSQDISDNPSTETFANAQALQKQARQLAQGCQTLEELKAAIEGFDGISIKKTAMNIVFADGNPKAPVMVIGEAPAGDDDKQGKPFLGSAGQLLDRILVSIGLNRSLEEVAHAVYLTNVLNWRPPGNRTPSEAEMNISLPFIERHIELIAPKIIILLGGGPGKLLLDKTESISKLRGRFHAFNDIPTIVTYPPAYLLTTPAQKRAVWQDILMVDAKRDELGLK